MDNMVGWRLQINLQELKDDKNCNYVTFPLKFFFWGEKPTIILNVAHDLDCSDSFLIVQEATRVDPAPLPFRSKGSISQAVAGSTTSS